MKGRNLRVKEMSEDINKLNEINTNGEGRKKNIEQKSVCFYFEKLRMKLDIYRKYMSAFYLSVFAICLMRASPAITRTYYLFYHWKCKLLFM